MKKISLLLFLCCSGCMVGPQYIRPSMTVPEAYKEVSKDWKVANPQDENDRGAWWKAFQDPTLNLLIEKLNGANQNIAVAKANYQQARALVKETQAQYFPIINSSLTSTRQQNASNTATLNNRTTVNSLSLGIAWEADLWGSIDRSVEANIAAFEASAAQLASTKLSIQSLLAQYYFELSRLDKEKTLLTGSVNLYQKLLAIMNHRHTAGTVSKLEVIETESQLQQAKADVLDNQLKRTQLEHAIAVLIGEVPAHFSLANIEKKIFLPNFPQQLPSFLLERRPDIAEAERLVAKANAEIGVYMAAFFPVLTLSSSVGIQQSSINRLLSHPTTFWSLGPQLAATLLDGNARRFRIKSAYANYEARVASYRQTVLTAFQEVEDNLVAIRILEAEALLQHKILLNAKRTEEIFQHQYQAGIVPLSEVLNRQLDLYKSKKTMLDITHQQLLAAIQLIKALGGNWDKASK